MNDPIIDDNLASRHRFGGKPRTSWFGWPWVAYLVFLGLVVFGVARCSHG